MPTERGQMSSTALFLRLMGDEDKGAALLAAVHSVAAGDVEANPQVFEVDPVSFERVPGAPFAYWVSDSVRCLFRDMEPLGAAGREAQRALSTNDDFRYIRLWWERDRDVAFRRPASGWLLFAKGGEYSPFYADIHLLVNWVGEGKEIEADALRKFPYLKGNANWVLHRECNYLRPGLTWPLRTQSGLALRAMPAGCIFGHKGPAAFVSDDDPEEMLALLAMTNSAAFRRLVELQMAFGSYEVGVIQRTPVPDLSTEATDQLAQLARRAWSLKRNLDTATLTSHAFVLPALLQVEGGGLDARTVVWFDLVQRTEQALAEIQSEIDARCFDFYGFAEADRTAAMGGARWANRGRPRMWRPGTATRAKLPVRARTRRSWPPSCSTGWSVSRSAVSTFGSLSASARHLRSPIRSTRFRFALLACSPVKKDSP